MNILKKALTFEDVLLVPQYSEVLPKEVDITTKFTKNINLNIPLVSAAMDTVTETRAAIAMALHSGIWWYRCNSQKYGYRKPSKADKKSEKKRERYYL